jgi:hypothetical protein
MCKLVETTMLKPEIIQTVVPTIIGEIKTELISELKSVIERCRLEGGFICSSEHDKGGFREEFLPRVLAFCTLCDLVVGI